MIDGLTIDERHVYRLRGQVVPSVTQVLTCVGITQPWKYAPGSAEFGTAVHHAIRLHGEGDLDESTLTPEVALYLEIWKSYVAGNPLTDPRFEVSGYDGRFGYAGTMDVVDVREHDVLLIDIKTGAREPGHHLQLAAYVELLRTRHRKPIDRRIVYLSDRGYQCVKDEPFEFARFTYALALTKWKMEKKLWSPEKQSS